MRGFCFLRCRLRLRQGINKASIWSVKRCPEAAAAQNRAALLRSRRLIAGLAVRVSGAASGMGVRRTPGAWCERDRRRAMVPSRHTFWGMPVAFIDVGFFAPIVVAGFAAGLIVRRWIVLVVAVALWVGTGAPGAVAAAANGPGDPLAMFGLWGLYLPIPFGLGLAAGVALGRLIRPPGRERRDSAAWRPRPPGDFPEAPV